MVLHRFTFFKKCGENGFRKIDEVSSVPVDAKNIADAEHQRGFLT